MGRPRRDLRRFRRLILAVVSGVQVPGVAAVAHLSGSWPLAVGGATLVTLPYLAGLKNPFDDRPKSRWHLAGLWPFFAWWTACLAFAALAPLVLAFAWLLRLPSDPALAVAGATALTAG